ncbi:MAG: HAMP domain-containing sensor histidine kinase [Cyanobacteria bacterium P01_D01_bin.56]
MYTTPPSWSNQQSEISSADIRQLCQSQIDRLSEKLPVLDVWLVCWNQLENKHDTLSYRHNREAEAKVESYLSSERWISENLPFLELKSLSISSDDAQVYVCGLGKTDAHWDYLLLLTEKHISRLQQDVVRDNAQLLQKYLTLYQENLRQRAKIKLLEETLHKAEHQLRNPLALIQLYSETIVLGAENEAQKRQAECIRQTTDEITENLGKLLNCGRQDHLHRKKYRLSWLLKHVLTLLSPAIEQKQLEIIHPAESLSITVDSWQFEQVLQNLLDNAIHHSPVGGAITLHWQACRQAVLISVSDQGPGLGDFNSSDLFRPFYTKRPGGKGLGLAIAKKIILDHQGSIGAETLPGGGARFSIFLPC